MGLPPAHCGAVPNDGRALPVLTMGVRRGRWWRSRVRPIALWLRPDGPLSPLLWNDPFWRAR